jgi:hypothetical protein
VVAYVHSNKKVGTLLTLLCVPTFRALHSLSGVQAWPCISRRSPRSIFDPMMCQRISSRMSASFGRSRSKRKANRSPWRKKFSPAKKKNSATSWPS